MAFYIRIASKTFNYKEDGTQVAIGGTMGEAKGYDTKAAAETVVNNNPSWIVALKNAGETIQIYDADTCTSTDV